MAALLCSTSLCGDITVSDTFLVSNTKDKRCWKRNSRLKFHTLKLGSAFHRKKQRKCSPVSMKGSDFSVSMINNNNKKTFKSSSEVTKALKSLPDTDSAFSYFKEVAQSSKLVHTTETCNHMLEALRVDGRIEEMGYVFDLMQKRIIKRMPPLS
ncbi:hypothetical protein Bca52824_092865 [Brassica carinata]|uniref:Pentatricopeptide repeat-containing protein n=1 Tax=Brassica carinata TaxID=52824 RepID=A0A8X7TKE3_BRACI|nr:hypothetical protein Bca52824_092865 [Brassica carinata]